MFTPEERRIYGPYKNGEGKMVKEDPVALYRLLLVNTQGNLNELLTQYNEGELGQAHAAPRLATAVIDAFGLEPYNSETGEGTLQDEALALLYDFLNWRDQKKTPLVNSPTSAPAMGQDGPYSDPRMPDLRIANKREQAMRQQVGQRPPSPMRRTTPSG